jgi:flagellar export protein FliJ
MKKYSFSLDRVLRVRRTQEDVARARLQAAASHARRAEEDVELARQRYDTATSGAAGMRGLALSALAVREQDMRRAIDVREAEVRLRQAENDRTDATDGWIAAKQGVSVLENLDARQRAAHEQEVVAEADAATDDLVTGRFRRRT